jgi:TatD DNase family protein
LYLTFTETPLCYIAETMIDTHCHLTHQKLLGEADDIIARARQAGLSGAVTIGTGVADAREGIKLRERFPDFVHLAAGLDPFTANRAGERFDDELAELEPLLKGGQFVALGEIGLDYHYDLDPRPVQAERLERQLDLAASLELPVVIHVREAHEDMMAILANHADCCGVIHSFTAGPAEAERYLDLGWYLGFNGVVTFKNAGEVREAAKLAPADRLVVETDSPYLAPVPVRGRRCEPAYVRHTLEFIAELRRVETTELDSATTANARSLFSISEL